MPVWKFPQIYVDFVATVDPIQFGIDGYAKYGLVSPAYGSVDLPGFQCEGLTGSIAEATLPAFDLSAEIYRRSAITGEATIPVFMCESTTGAIAEGTMPAITSEADVLAGAIANGEVSFPRFSVESNTAQQSFFEAQITLPSLSVESVCGAIAECSFPAFTSGIEASSSFITDAEVTFPVFALEANIAHGAVTNGACSIPMLSAEALCGSVASMEMSAFHCLGDIAASRNVLVEATIPRFSIESDVYSNPTINAEATFPAMRVEGTCASTIGKYCIMPISYSQDVRGFVSIDMPVVACEAEAL